MIARIQTSDAVLSVLLTLLEGHALVAETRIGQPRTALLNSTSELLDPVKVASWSSLQWSIGCQTRRSMPTRG